MRLARMLLPALAFVALACAPCRRPGPPHGHDMIMPCGPGACGYKSLCYSDGAIRSNDGVCQTCSGGKWTAGTGCRESTCHECCGKMGRPAPCDHGRKERHH